MHHGRYGGVAGEGVEVDLFVGGEGELGDGVPPGWIAGQGLFDEALRFAAEPCADAWSMARTTGTKTVGDSQAWSRSRATPNRWKAVSWMGTEA